jgi:hypothetical protein
MSETGERRDHDQRLKALLRLYLPEFLDCFLPERAAEMDFSSVEFLEQEVFPDPPGGPRRAVDVVARLRLRRPHAGSDEHLALIHVEIEGSATVEELGDRLAGYGAGLTLRHGLPVLPVALMMHIGLDGVGVRERKTFVGAFEQSVFRWLYVGLPALDAEQYAAKSGNPWSVPLLGLMRHDPSRAARLAAEALLRVAALPGPTDQGKYLLAECMQAYLVRDPAQRLDLNRVMVEPRYKEVRNMVKTFGEEAMELGIEKGRRRMLLEQLEDRFGPVPEEVKRRIEDLPAERLRELARAVLRAASPADLGVGWDAAAR